MKKNSENNTKGIGFMGALQLVFITLKLIGKIDWEWWKVLLPIEVDLGIAIVICIFLIIAKMTAKFIKNMEKKVR